MKRIVRKRRAASRAKEARGQSGSVEQLTLQFSAPQRQVVKPAKSHKAALSPARPSPVYETYWRFAAERQRIFFSRLAGDPAPWTVDPILGSYKFTNAYRASDRVSQYLIRNV